MVGTWLPNFLVDRGPILEESFKSETRLKTDFATGVDGERRDVVGIPDG
jgi:hypothetical protein